MNTILVSDVHLDVAPSGRETMELFTQFLRDIDPARFPRLIVLGDLFDFWFEYRHVVFSGYFDVLRAFARLADAGVEIHFAVGNHDFWAGRFLREHLDFQIHDGPFTLPFGPYTARIVHGDGINPSDHSYRLYKRIARWRPVVSAFSLIHPDWAMAIAQGVSKGSRHLHQTKDLSKGSEVAPQRTYAEKALRAGEADIIACGHSHYPVLERVAEDQKLGLYMNSGDWLYHRSYITWEEGVFTLRLFSADGEDIDKAQVVTEGATGGEAE